MDSGVTGTEKDGFAMQHKGDGVVEKDHDQIGREVHQGAVGMGDTYVDSCC